jgi:hypothetical protein
MGRLFSQEKFSNFSRVATGRHSTAMYLPDLALEFQKQFQSFERFKV